MITIHVEKTASRGIVIGKAFLVEKPSLDSKFPTIEKQNVENEIKRYEGSVANAQADLEVLAKKNSIFMAHLEMVKDITLYEGVITKIREDLKSAEAALKATSEEFIQIFEAMDNEYIRERAADIKDITYRLMCELQGFKMNAFENMKEEVVVIAKDLTPSDTMNLDINYVKGFITQEGGVTSHVSILAKGLGIPALVGVSDLLYQVKNDDMIIMDAGKGIILIHPDEATIDKYQELQREQIREQEELIQIDSLPGVTKDGKVVELCANVGSIRDIKKAVEYNIDGVGLFRSEFLYIENTNFPTEEDQYQAYKEAALLCGKELTIRTLDIGGDKDLPYFEFEKEENPFLGWRAIRISLEMTDMFKTQLRAILRASAFGKIRIMFPMIISLEELYESKILLEECKKELKSEQIPFDESIEVGMMIETPAAVILAEEFASEVDFFSIGTNDLTQYILAVDRGNKKISRMYNSFHPSVLRSIKKIISAGHKKHIKVGMCGEFASDERAVILLLGLGLDEFSMSASEVLKVKYLIRNTTLLEAQVLAEKACKMKTIEEVYQVLNVKD